MSTSTEQPLERVNYYNGQRLEATDLEAEQQYHIRVRRLLNKSLYTPGIVEGLEVTKDPDDTHRVIVSPGVAFDDQGREIILLEQTSVQVHGVPNTSAQWSYGNYLTIEYDEQTTSVKSDGCTSGGTSGSACDHAWDGPTRIRATPQITMQDAWPRSEDGRVILAQIELDETCAVADIRTTPRSYVETADNSTRSFVLEGEKAINKDNPKKLSFVVVGAPATSVTLYLWGEAFPSLFYTEVGKHTHVIPEMTTGPNGTEDDRTMEPHQHEFELDPIKVLDTDSAHGHEIRFPANRESTDSLDNLKKATAINVNKEMDGLLNLIGDFDDAEVTGGKHTHPVEMPGIQTTGFAETTVPTHSHDIPSDVTEPRGQDIDVASRSEAHRYIDDLQVRIDGDVWTTDVLGQLGWSRLGNGGPAHELSSGTGAIKLDALVEFNEGEHTIELWVDSLNETGGTIRYLLYVE